MVFPPYKGFEITSDWNCHSYLDFRFSDFSQDYYRTLKDFRFVVSVFFGLWSFGRIILFPPSSRQ